MAQKKEKQYVSDNAQLMAEWNWEKNSTLTFDPQVLTVGSERKAWWRCSNGHEWQASVNSRNRGNGCPYCAGRRVICGENDLQTINPTLASEWDYDKNNGLTPIDVMPNSNRKVWWRCSNGHKWQATIANRNAGKGCPYCSRRYVLEGTTDLQTVNPSVLKEWNYEKNGSLKPEKLSPNSHLKVWWKCQKGHEWKSTIANRNYGRGCPICSAEQNTSFPEYAIIFYLEKYGVASMQSYREYGYELDVYIPSLKTAIEYDGYRWHKDKTEQDLDKNCKCKKDGIKLYRIREGLLPLNHYSIDFAIQRNQKDLPIAIAAVLSEIVGTTIEVDLSRDAVYIENLREYLGKEKSILTTNPEIAIEWNHEKNGILKPEYFKPASKAVVWWQCGKGHEWKAKIADRYKGNSCPYCSGQKVLPGYNDLLTINPNLAAEWNYGKNANMTPENFTPNSNKRFWWKCGKGHEWQATIANRNSGKGCPYCSGRYAIRGETDLQTAQPILAREWNFSKNGELTPADVKPNSHIKVWWKCREGHEWQAIIADRNRGRGCPQCARNKRKANK